MYFGQKIHEFYSSSKKTEENEDSYFQKLNDEADEKGYQLFDPNWKEYCGYFSKKNNNNVDNVEEEESPSTLLFNKLFEKCVLPCLNLNPKKRPSAKELIRILDEEILCVL